MASTDPSIEMFIEKLLSEKQFQNLEPEVHEQLKEDLLSRVQDHINAALLNELSEEKVKEFETLLDTEKDPDSIRKFLSQHIPDMDQVVAGALLRFHNMYIGR